MGKGTLLVAVSVLAIAGSVASGQVIGTNFTGTSRPQSGFIPPDTMGSVGPTEVWS